MYYVKFFFAVGKILETCTKNPNLKSPQSVWDFSKITNSDLQILTEYYSGHSKLFSKQMFRDIKTINYYATIRKKHAQIV